MRHIAYIFVHCTATPRHTSVQALLNGFKQRGWQHPGYHYLITEDGEVAQLTSEELVANGVLGYNATAIHVAYTGGIDANGRPADTRSYSQMVALEAVIKLLHWRYPHAKVLGHHEVNPHKSCPCFDVHSIPLDRGLSLPHPLQMRWLRTASEPLSRLAVSAKK